MSEYLKKLAAEKMGHAYSPKERSVPASHAWYSDDNLPLDQAESPRGGDIVATLREPSESVQSEDSGANLGAEIEKLETAVITVESLQASSDFGPENDTEACEALNDLNDAILEVENLVKVLQLSPTGMISSDEALTVESGRISRLIEENELLKQRAINLEEERDAFKRKIEGLERGVREPTIHSKNPQSGSEPLMTASMRLKSVSAALNKALNSKMSSITSPKSPSSPKAP